MDGWAVTIEQTNAYWLRCRYCRHRINPNVGVCDEAWQHNPCTPDGCVPEQKEHNK